MATVGIYGSGCVGRATGKALQAVGHICIYTDTRVGTLAELQGQGLDARPIEAMADAGTDASMICVPTPAEGAGMDFAFVEDAAWSVGRALARSDAYHVVALRSTVPPGTLRRRVLPLLERASGRRVGRDIGLCACPEFLREASAEQDALYPWIVVIGAHDRRAGEVMEGVYAPLSDRTGCPVVVTDLETAEYAKCVSNAFNAVKITFFNQMAELAERTGASAEVVGEIVARSAEGMWNPRYGIRAGAPFGGACLPKDARALSALAYEHDADLSLLRAALRYNDALGERPEALSDAAQPIGPDARVRAG